MILPRNFNNLKCFFLNRRKIILNYILELGKIRKIILVNGKELVSEITKKQRDIIKKLNLDIEYVPKNPRV